MDDDSFQDHRSSQDYRVIEVTVWSTEEEAFDLADRIGLLLCPHPEHPGPCPVPWQTAVRDAEEESPAVADLREQVRHEYPEAVERPS